MGKLFWPGEFVGNYITRISAVLATSESVFLYFDIVGKPLQESAKL